jgi:hypothetical protein
MRKMDRTVGTRHIVNRLFANSYAASPSVNVDVDMLPTVLVYRGGQLEHTFIRVDWEAGQGGIQNLLIK